MGAPLTQVKSTGAGRPAERRETRGEHPSALDRFRVRLNRIPITRIAVLLLAAGAAARLVRYALCFPLWGDEAFVAVDFLVREFWDFWAPTTYRQIVPLGYMWITYGVTRVAGVSEYALRLPALVAGVAALPLLWWWARRVAPAGAAMLALGLLAAAYYPIRHAVEVKPYSGDLLLALLVWIGGWLLLPGEARHCRLRTLRRGIAAAHTSGRGAAGVGLNTGAPQHPASGDPNPPALWALWAVLAAAAVWASYPVVFVAGGVLLVLGWSAARRRNRGALAGTIAAGVLLAASFGAMYWSYARPHAAGATGITEEWGEEFPPLARPWELPLWLLRTHTGNMLAYPLGGSNFGSIGTTLLAIVGAVWLGRRQPATLGLLLAPLALNFVAAALQKYPYGGTARVMLYAAPAFCLLAGIGMYALLWRIAGPIHRPGAVRLAGLALMGVAAGSIVRDAIEPYKKDANQAMRSTLRELSRDASPQDQFIAFHAATEVPHAPYLGAWKGDGAQFVYYARTLLPGGVQLAPPPESVTAGAGATHLLAYGGRNFLRTPEAQADFDAKLREYRDVLEARLGAAEHARYILQERRGIVLQRLDVYSYGRRAGPRP